MKAKKIKRAYTKRKVKAVESYPEPLPEVPMCDGPDQIQSNLTPYDHRLSLVREISFQIEHIDLLYERVTFAKLELAELRNKLANVNREIRNEITLDQSR